MLHTLLEKFRYLWMRHRFDRDLTAEMQFHLETRIMELLQQGLPPDDATWQARREFGSVARFKEDSRAAWHVMWLESMASSLWHAARAFRRNPAFAAIAVVCLALGILLGSLSALGLTASYGHSYLGRATSICPPMLARLLFCSSAA